MKANVTDEVNKMKFIDKDYFCAKKRKSFSRENENENEMKVRGQKKCEHLIAAFHYF